jgi:hypothetical protein
VDLAARIGTHLARMRTLLDKDLAAFNALARERGVPAVVTAAPAAAR